MKNELKRYHDNKNKIVIFRNDDEKVIGLVSKVEDDWFVMDEISFRAGNRLHVMPYSMVQCVLPIEEYLKAGGNVDD
jgi:hypothetical protein